MRLVLLFLFLAAGALYTAAAVHSYREEVQAREPSGAVPAEESVHPGTSLRILREAIDRGDYSDALLPYLEHSLEAAPSFYQPPLLMAAFYANRLEHPELIRQSFEAAVARFPSNGRLHLTYAEWLLTPRATAPYRAYREEGDPGLRALGLDHLETATSLEPDLTRKALALLLRFQIPVEQWEDRLPSSDQTKILVLDAVDGAPRERETQARILKAALEGASGLELYRSIAYYGERWGEPEVALEAAAKWREAALTSGLGSELAQATTAMVRRHFDSNAGDKAYGLLRATLEEMEERNLPTENSLELLCAVGTEYLNRYQYAMAQALFAEAVARSRYHMPAYLGLARTYRALGDLEGARRELESILAIDPSNEQALGQLEELVRLSLSRR